ncbi:MAG TPA: PDZ domain-containing protein [Vicinamibacterales bacterium]|nr:PDZ domain-containing protein [Vicinamibacterales bacterium]
MLCVRPAAAQQLEPIRYTLSFPAPYTHYVEVDASIPTDGQPQVDLMMPVWTPGSYLVREYSRNVESLTATGANDMPLPVGKTRKNRWRVEAGGARTISLHYRLYCREMSVRTNWIDEEFAQLNGAATYITRLESRDRPYEVRLRLPPGWARSLSGMTSPEPNVFRAPDYDTLVDSPIVAGNPAVYEFSAGGKPHYLVDVGEAGVWDGARAVQDLAKVVQKTIDLWGGAPYDRFYLFNMIGAPGNGLEHKNSIVIETPRLSTSTPAGYHAWLRLASHEFFHPWNVKRLRPIELGPFDYENEVYTKGLWFAEGVTDYYADLQVRRAGLAGVEEYLQDLSGAIANLQNTPGRLVLSAEMASYDAWIKYYRPNENSTNDSVSYYVKGAVIGFLLDARIRHATAGVKTLDDFMRLMYQRYSGAHGFTSADLRATAVDLAGPSAKDDFPRWFQKTLETTEELDYREALDWFGLDFRAPSSAKSAYLGVATTLSEGRTFVTGVTRGTPAFDAGMEVDDEIIAIDGVRLPAGQFAARIAAFRPAEKITFTISRRNLIRSLDVMVGTAPAQSWSLVVKPDATPGQTAHLKAWLQ